MQVHQNSDSVIKMITDREIEMIDKVNWICSKQDSEFENVSIMQNIWSFKVSKIYSLIVFNTINNFAAMI